MRYDIERIKESLTAFDVADYFGLEVFRKGRNKFIYCPGHYKRLGKEDSSANNCVLMDEGYYCYACGVFVPVIDMIMEIADCNLYEAFGIAGDIAGGRNLYIADNLKDDTEKCEERIYLKKHDLEFIGLCGTNKSKVFYPINLCDKKRTKDKNKKVWIRYSYADSGDICPEFVLCEKTHVPSFLELASTDYATYCELIRNKAFETYCHWANMYLYESKRELSWARQALLNVLLGYTKRAKQIYQLYENEDEGKSVKEEKQYA